MVHTSEAIQRCTTSVNIVCEQHDNTHTKVIRLATRAQAPATMMMARANRAPVPPERSVGRSSGSRLPAAMMKVAVEGGVLGCASIRESLASNVCRQQHVAVILPCSLWRPGMVLCAWSVVDVEMPGGRRRPSFLSRMTRILRIANPDERA